MHLCAASAARERDSELLLIGSPNALALRRTRGEGPRYHRIGRRILYRGCDLNRFLEECAVEPTAHRGGPARPDTAPGLGRLDGPNASRAAGRSSRHGESTARCLCEVRPSFLIRFRLSVSVPPDWPAVIRCVVRVRTPSLGIVTRVTSLDASPCHPAPRRPQGAFTGRLLLARFPSDSMRAGLVSERFRTQRS